MVRTIWVEMMTEETMTCMTKLFPEPSLDANHLKESNSPQFFFRGREEMALKEQNVLEITNLLSTIAPGVHPFI